MSSKKPVSVTAVRFTQSLEVVPKRIEFDGISYDLNTDYKKINLGGDEGRSTLFDVSDGARRFRLRQEEQPFTWWLLG